MDGASALKLLDEIIHSGRKELQAPIELPEPALKLDIASRQHNEGRLFKHIHQVCMLHVEIFRRANQIKLVYVLEGFRSMVQQKNPIGIYAMARSLLEFAAFTGEINRRLSAICANVQKSWQERGQDFFTTIVRARFGTTNPEKLQVLLDNGLKAEDAKPFHIHTCIQKTSKRVGCEWMQAHYEFLCDYVHHNLSSQSVAARELNVGKVVTSPQGGLLITPDAGPNVVYAYPADVQAEFASAQTLSRAATGAQFVITSLNSIPHSPYTDEEILAQTGHPLGVVQLQRPLRDDDPCHCGSGMKFRRCHGKVRH